MASNEQHTYVLGTRAEELVRLGFQHRVWAKYAFDIWERANFAPGQTILDVGCGPGFATLDLARIAGTGRVVAVDGSAKFIDHLQGQLAAQDIRNVQTQVVDVQELALPPRSVHRAYVRWVLCFVRDPGTVVQRIADALVPGGILAVQDYFHYESCTLAPKSDIFTRIIRATGESWRRHGGDPDLAGRLPAILHKCGFEVREITPILRVAIPGTALWHWPTSFFLNYVPSLLEMGLISKAEADEFNAEWARRSNDPNSFFCTPPVFDIIAVKK